MGRGGGKGGRGGGGGRCWTVGGELWTGGWMMADKEPQNLISEAVVPSGKRSRRDRDIEISFLYRYIILPIVISLEII